MSSGAVTKTIFDLGMHKGEDTEFYLALGYNVLAIEANPDLCQKAEDKFPNAISTGQLRILPVAVAASDGEISFYKNTSVSAWSTTDPEWAKRNLLLGTDHVEVKVPARRLANIVEEFGTPEYMKIDIEGADRLCIEAISTMDQPPAFVSVEVEKASIDDFAQDLALLWAAGYRYFQLVPQHRIHKAASFVAIGGAPIHHDFPFGSSGPFGKYLPRSRWVSAAKILRQHRRNIFRENLLGHHSKLRNVPLINNMANANRTSKRKSVKFLYRFVRAGLHKLRIAAGHYDLHAAISM